MRSASLLARLRSLAIDVSPLRDSRDFRLLWSGQAISNLGRQITTVAVPFQVYLLTQSYVAVGVLGLVQVLPYVAVSLFAGHLADVFDRRRVLLLAQSGMAFTSLLLWFGAMQHTTSIAFLYVVAAAASAISAIDLPARSATVPNIVPRRDLAAALSLNFAQFQTALIAGPAVGGLIIARLGLPLAYAIDVVTFGAALASVWALSPQPVREREADAPLTAVVRGLQFAWRERPILGGFLADLNAMFFGMPRALFPGLAVSTYHGGAVVLGLLYAAPAAGAVIGALGSGFVGSLRHQGRAVLVSVAIWGSAIALVGVAIPWLWICLALLAVGGAADAISAICRSTILQTLTPDRLRGRLSAANSMVVVGGPYIGDFRAGTVATLTSPELALVSGGLICIGLTAAIAARFPQMVAYDSSKGLRPA